MASSADDALIGSVILASLSSGRSAMAPPLLQLNDSEYTGCFFLCLRNGCVDARKDPSVLLKTNLLAEIKVESAAK